MSTRNSAPTILDTMSPDRKRRLARTGIALGTAAAVGVLSVLAINANKSVEPDESVATVLDHKIEKAIAEHDTKALVELGVTQLQGGVEVKPGSNVRTTPSVYESDGETNLDSTWTELSHDSAHEIVLLASPYIVNDPENPANGRWFGAVDPDTGKVSWVNESVLNLQNERIVEADTDQPSAIYEMNLETSR